jgi:site-specific recombinase XerD
MLLDFPKPSGWAEKHGSHYIVIKNKWHRLCRVSQGAIPFWRAYYRLTKADPEFMAGVLLAFLEEGLPQMVTDGDLTAATAKKYEQYIINRLIPYCGHMYRTDINQAHVASYLQKRKEAKAPSGGNRERAAWSTCNEWAMRKGWLTWNPCRGVRRNKERPAQGYIEHAPLVEALDRATVEAPELYPLMGVAYLLGIRQTDLRLAELTQLVGDSLQVVESKTRKVNEHPITPTVRVLINKAIEHKAGVAARYDRAAENLERLSQHRRAAAARQRAAEVRADPHIFVSARGLPWTESGLGSALQRFDAGFKFRQLRGKAETDGGRKGKTFSDTPGRCARCIRRNGSWRR